MVLKHETTCPCCCEKISMLYTTSLSSQTYLEECEKCSKPMEINIAIRDNANASVSLQVLG